MTHDGHLNFWLSFVIIAMYINKEVILFRCLGRQGAQLYPSCSLKQYRTVVKITFTIKGGGGGDGSCYGSPSLLFLMTALYLVASSSSFVLEVGPFCQLHLPVCIPL